MAKTNAPKANEGGAQTIEKLQERFQELNTKKIQAGTNLQHAEERLGELKAQARDKYGTDDLQQLQAKLEEMKAENERKRAKYQQDLDKIESDLSEVEKQFKTESSPGEKEAR